MSSTMEHLLMQIFDRKHWIEEQFKHQVESYGQSIASNLLAEGHRPPPWIWTSGSDGLGWPHPKELNREQLISEILDPFPRVITPANNSSVFILPTLKGKNVNLFSSGNFFTNTCSSNGYFEVKTSDELVTNDVPEGSKRNPETMAEPKVTEDYSNLRQPTRTQTSTPKHTEPDMPPFKRAKTIKHPVEENTLHEFTGRVATCLNHDCVKDNSNDTRSRYKAQKFHSVDKSSKLAKPQNDVLSVPSASSESHGLTSSAAKKIYLDADYTAENGCQITNSLSSRLSAISLSDSAHCYDGIGGYPDENSISGSEVENHSSASVSLLKSVAVNILSCPESSASRQLSKDVLHALRTTRRIEAADGDSTEVPFKEIPEVEDLECDFHLTCNDCKSSAMTNHLSSNEETCQTSKNSPVSLLLISDCKLNNTSNHLKELQVDSRESAIGSLRQCTPEKHCSGKMIEFLEPDPDIFISNDKCDLNKNPIDATVKERQNGLEASRIKNSALTDKLVSGGSKSSTHNTSRRRKIMQIMQGGVSDAVDTVIHREEIHRVSNRGPEERPELAGGNSECITPASYAKGCAIFENALSNSSPVKDCLLNFCMDSSGHTSDLSDVSRKSTFRNLVQHTEEEDYHAKPKEVLIDFELEKKSKDTYPVETVHLPLRRIEECDSNLNLAADLDTANRVSDDGQAERLDIIGTDDLGCNSYLSVCNANALLPAISSSKENATACSSTDTGNMLNSMRGLSVQPTLMVDNDERSSEISTQYTDGEKCTEEPEIEITGNSLEQTDCAHFDGPILYFSDTNDAPTGVQQIDNSTEEITHRNIAEFVGSPDASRCQNAMLEGKRDTEEIDSVNDSITPDDEKMCDAVPKSRYFLRSSSSHEKHYSSLESNRIDYSNNSKQVDHACDITWPKRKKLKGRSNNVLATSPRLRVETHKHIEQKIDLSCRTSLNNTSGSSNGVPPFMLSHEMEVELSEAALGQSEEEHLSKKRRMMEGDYDMRGKCQGIRTPLSIKHIDGLYLDLAAENSSEITESTSHNLEQYYVLQGRQDSLVTFEHRSPSKFGSFDESTDMGKIHVGDGISCVEDSTDLSKQHDKDLDGIQKTMPEFEGFSINVPPIVEDEVIFNDSEIPSLSKERASLLEKLCGSESMLAAKSCASSKYNIDKIPDAYHSLPADIMEQLNFSNSLCVNGIDLDQYRTTKDDEITDPFCSLGSEFDGSLLRSHLYKLPPSNSKYAREAGKPPLTPPVEKRQQRMISMKSVASSEELGSNPELVCFRIDENSCITGEESNSEQRVHSRGAQISTNRIALADMTSVYQNMPTSVSVCREHLERGSLDSTNTVLPSEITCKENANISVSTVQSAANSFHSRFSKLDISGKANERNRVRSVSEKWGKPNNIVSNISSFIPLVQEKQQAAAPGIGGKRDIKVKALEAAEAAKHLEEKRQYEREMKKAAAKLERVRLEQENVRQLELKKKQKEESRKKKEADLEARKRQREADKIEKERKRQCTEKARKQQRVHVERLRIEKGVVEKGNKGCRDKNANEKKRKGKELSKEAKKQPQLAKERKITACRNTEEVEPSISNVVAGDSRHISCGMEAHGAFLKTNYSDERVNNPQELQTAIQDRMSVTTKGRDFLSYEISPYKDSDDEDGDEDCIRKKKCFPSWARREPLDQILLSTHHLDPNEIFARKSSFDLNEVLSPQVHRQLPPS